MEIQNSQSKREIAGKFKIYVILLIAFILILSACSNNPNKNLKTGKIEMIQLECIQLCEEREDKPFDQRQFDEKAAITIFVNAIKRASPMTGSLDYGAEFELTITFKDQSALGYHLSLGKEKGNRGLLVPLSNTHQGYTIKAADADKLRDLIWE